jgi:gamma-glutamylcyclotransferase (GGCT)/AIG2-like uncharacterized protein YtfP
VAERRLFVYGSLRRGGQHHDLLRGACYSGEVETRPGYALYQQGDYPALAEGSGVVAGELWLVHDALLRELDVFEGCPELYQRGEVVLCDGSRAVAYLVSSERAAELVAFDC